jgi:hypothetical protein
MSEKYALVNPYIRGDLNNSFTGKNGLDAANKAYSKLSNYFNNNVPKFYFTLQKIKNTKSIGKGRINDYLHFKVVETKDGKSVQYKIVPYDMTGSGIKVFKKKLSKILLSEKKLEGGSEQEGGKRKKSKKKSKESSSSSSDWLSDSEDHKYKKAISYQPIYHWWYDPYLYKLQKMYIPTFVPPLTPYVEIDLIL